MNQINGHVPTNKETVKHGAGELKKFQDRLKSRFGLEPHSRIEAYPWIGVGSLHDQCSIERASVVSISVGLF